MFTYGICEIRDFEQHPPSTPLPLMADLRISQSSKLSDRRLALYMFIFIPDLACISIQDHSEFFLAALTEAHSPPPTSPGRLDLPCTNSFLPQANMLCRQRSYRYFCKFRLFPARHS